MLAILLMLCAIAGIAWPFVRKEIEKRKPEPVEENKVLPQTARRREELCPRCSRMNGPDARKCSECGAEMPIIKLSNFLAGANNEELIREGITAGILLLFMVVAMLLANFLPMPGKIFMLLATIAALGYRVMRTVIN